MEKKYKVLIDKLYKAHEVYLICNEDQKARLIESCVVLIDQLISFGRVVNSKKVDERFYLTLLLYGNEFLMEEYGNDREKLFGNFEEDMKKQEIEELDKMKEVGGLTGTRSGGRFIAHKPKKDFKNDLVSLWKDNKSVKEVERELINHYENKSKT